MTRPRFHLALPVPDLDACRRFYTETLGAPVGREATRWVDVDLWGHQVSLHLVEDTPGLAGHNPVDGDTIPVPHFGVILDPPDWRALADRLDALDADFVLRPKVRFAGEAGEQGTFFVRDPGGNVLEFKCFADDRMVFERGD